MRELLVCCDMTLLNIYDDCTAKQIGCFNHRLVTLVADKLWLWESVYFGINWIRQPEKQVPNYNNLAQSILHHNTELCKLLVQ